MKRLHSFLHLTPPLHADMKPNLIYRKAKMAGKTVEKYAAKKISVPKIQGEPLFGIYPVLEALQIRHRTFHKVFVKPSFRERAQKDENIGRIFDLVEELELDVVDVNHDQLDRLTEFQLHNGVCVDASILPFLEYKSKRLSLFLDRVLDPGNVGAIGRTAFYFGADGISYVKGRGPKKVTPSMSKSSCGALERLPVEQVPSFEHFYQKSKDAGAQIVATCDPAAAQRFGLRCTELKSWRPSSNVALVLGDEGIGIREEILKRCDVVVTIPHVVASEKLSSVTSLNVSVVAGILLQHVASF